MSSTQASRHISHKSDKDGASSASRSNKNFASPKKGGNSNKDDHHHLSEIEVLKLGIAEKNNQIAHLNQAVDQFNQLTDSLTELIKDLEESTSVQLFNAEVTQSAFSSTHELVHITRKGMNELLKIHKEMPQRFEEDFEEKVAMLTEKIDRKRKKIEDINNEIKKIEDDTKMLERMAHIQETETKALKEVSDSLESQKNSVDESHRTESSFLEDQIQTIKSDIRDLKKTVRGKNEKNEKAIQLATQPLSKRTLDSMREDIEINEEIESLERRLNREYQEHEMTNSELEIILVDIQRAKAVIRRFKNSLTKEEKIRHERVNNYLKDVIEQQREEFKRAIKNQKKANSDFEKQKNDLIEEEKILRTYLQSLEKQLREQMQKLPSLALLQHRYDPQEVQRKTAMSRSKQRAPDDPEMRTIKKAILRLQNRRVVSKSVLVGRNMR